MRRYRTLAGIAAAAIVAVSVFAISSGGTPALPPPVTMRGETPSTRVTVADTGLEFVPPTVVDMAPPASLHSPSTTTVETAASPDIRLELSVPDRR